MSRVKSSSVNKKHKKILKKTKGFIGRRKNVYKISKQAYLKSLFYSYRDRKKKKSYFRRFFISTIKYYLNSINIKYNYFFYLLNKKKIVLNRKMIYTILKEKDYFIINELIKMIGC
ncbi:50S ribosomal protein L20 [Candidatus Vidania fulgoroideorum]